jgi:hypothetical protein
VGHNYYEGPQLALIEWVQTRVMRDGVTMNLALQEIDNASPPSALVLDPNTNSYVIDPQTVVLRPL